ncbi:MAG: hypothetical protein LBS49_14990 [Candidatus Accumulibacter sp.]|jgi:hypothetical protein|nr:hypothetical protein [Accumulibacter sp.]
MLLKSGALLIDRLIETCPAACGNVFAAADLAEVQEALQITPALHVLLLDYQPVETTPTGAIRWDETWCVVAVVKHAARRDRASAQQHEAAPLLGEVIRGLSNWRFPLGPGRAGRCKIVPGPRPGVSTTHAYFSIGVSVVSVTERAHDT